MKVIYQNIETNMYYFSIKEIATAESKCPSTISRWIKQGKGYAKVTAEELNSVINGINNEVNEEVINNEVNEEVINNEEQYLRAESNEEKTEIYCYAYKNKKFINEIKNIGGKWDYRNTRWIVPCTAKTCEIKMETIAEIYDDIFGVDIEKTNHYVDVQITAKSDMILAKGDMIDHKWITIMGRYVTDTPDYVDSKTNIRVANDVEIVQGKIDTYVSRSGSTVRVFIEAGSKLILSHVAEDALECFEYDELEMEII